MSKIDNNTTGIVHLIGIATVAALTMGFATIVWMGDYLTQVGEALGT